MWLSFKTSYPTVFLWSRTQKMLLHSTWKYARLDIDKFSGKHFSLKRKPKIFALKVQLMELPVETELPDVGFGKFPEVSKDHMGNFWSACKLKQWWSKKTHDIGHILLEIQLVPCSGHESIWPFFEEFELIFSKLDDNATYSVTFNDKHYSEKGVR